MNVKAPLLLGSVGALLLFSAWGCGGSDSDAADGDTSDADGVDVAGTGGSSSDSADSSDADGDAGGGDGTGGAAPLAEKPSAGCNGEATALAGQQTLQVGELERGYWASFPADYDPSHAYPLVFAFHGQGNSGEGVSNQWYLGVEQQGGTPSIFIYPDGLDGGDGTGWPNIDGRDVAFFDALLTTMKADYCVDENRVFSTGHSYGGIMTYTLACERAEVLRAVAPVAGSRWANTTCTGPVAAWGAHGNPDPTVAYEGGVEAMARILETNGCDPDDTTPTPPTDTCIAYSCDPGYPVTWCEHDQGHDWPAFAAASIKTFFDSF